ncbi:MAG TPA: DUF1638 domain-containing protein [Clostridiaceae bacterium]|nr:DUF1638 domain-containing protein [Clostridiaceae bacterium]
MKYKLICCEVFMRIVCMEIATTSNTIDPEFTKLGAHENPDSLRDIIQEKIDSIREEDGYDAVLLGYGLCGNAALRLKAGSVPLVIPRAHDCCTIFLGSKDRFLEHFKDRLSASWSSAGYAERSTEYLRETDTGKFLGLDRSYQELVEQYGEDNARYIWDILHPENYQKDDLIYIRIPEFESLGYLEKLKEKASQEGRNVQVLEGDTRLIKKLINGQWDEEEFLLVPPGRSIAAVYDHKEIICVE